MTIEVHTLQARDNVLMQMLQHCFDVTNDRLGHTIADALAHTSAALAQRGVKYPDLRAALTPSAERSEIGLIFDISAIPNAWYGYDIFAALLPLVGHESSHSVLFGDLLDHRRATASWLSIHLRPSGRFFEERTGTAYCCVYLNNCTPALLERLHAGLSSYMPYLGYVDMTYGSEFKAFLSRTLQNVCILHRNVVIQRHEDDAPPDTNQNTLAYPFEESGYACRSIGDIYFGLLLSYKIERPVLTGDERDQVISLAAIHPDPIDIADCALEIDDAKWQ